MSITVNNYLEERAKIDFSKLPEKYKKVDEFIAEAIDFYGQDAEIDKTIDEGIKQLNLHQEEKPKPLKLEKLKVSPAVKKVVKEDVEDRAKAHEQADTAKKQQEAKQAEEKQKEEFKKEVESELHKIVSGGDMSMAQIVAEGRRINELRSFRSQFIDNGSDNKRRLTPTKENLVRWMKNPGRFDLIGVDTASATDATADLKHVKKETILHLIGFKK